MSFDFDIPENEKPFSLNEYIKYYGFKQTRDSDKRDLFEMEYLHPFDEVVYTVHLTIHHNIFFKYYTITLMEIKFERNSKQYYHFKSVAPRHFDDAKAIFELVLPTKEYFEKFEEPGE